MNKRRPIVYIVDDDVSICRALSLLLESYGFKTATFTRALSFLAFNHPKVPSCLILDVYLPTVNGFALQAAMTKRGIVTPIIFISGHGDIPMSVKAMKAGAVDFLTKPFSKQKIVNAVMLAIEKSKTQNKKQDEIAKINRRVKSLSPRELEVFRFVVKGMLNKQIAFKRGISLQTIKVHRGRVMQKMQAKTVTELIRLAQKAGLIPPQR
jgi:FixJ family two-component response regulator